MEMLERIRDVLDYDRETGLFTWKKNTSKMKLVGRIAGFVGCNGYVKIRVFRKLYLGHRLAWLYFYGEIPPKDIDHINGLRYDNRISNLRLADASMNMQNRRKCNRNNNLGLLGVSKYKNRFVAQISLNGKVEKIGRFKTAEEAHSAYVKRKRELHAGCTI